MAQHTRGWQLAALGAVVCGAGLGACTHGGDDDEPPRKPSSFTVQGKVVDGALQGALACYDLNDNRACDGDEPRSAPSAADGSYRIDGIAPADIGKHRVVVDVPAAAIDADTGTAVGRAFQLAAPARGDAGDHAVFVSPLTNLVALQMDHTGQTIGQAARFVEAELGLAVSPLGDFTSSASADHIKAGHAARLAQATAWKQTESLAAAVGQIDLSGAVVTRRQVDALATSAVLGALPIIGAAAADASLQDKTGADLRAAVDAMAGAAVAQIGLTVPEAVATIGVASLPPEPARSEAPVAAATLAALRFNSAADWSMRSLQATAADNTPDASGRLRYYDVRTRVDATYPGGINWSLGNDPARAGDRFWNGTTWRTCDPATRGTVTPRDAAGHSSYTYCDGFEAGTSVRRAVDISGQGLRSVLTDRIRTMPGGSSGLRYADWGPADLSLLDGANFPAGSLLYYQNVTPVQTAFAYDDREVARVPVFSQSVAEGGDGRIGAAPACFEPNPPTTPATSLEELVARSPGRPCISNTATNADGTSLTPNEGWWNSTASMGSVANYFSTPPAGTGNFYTSEGRMRVAFTGSGNGTIYYACYVRRTNPSTRNCQRLGSGTYAIATLGDARVMSFSGVPVDFTRTNFQRVFVERGGSVYIGYRNLPGITSSQVRLSLVAANALLGQLGLPPIAP